MVAPANTLPADLRCSDNEALQQWFRRVVGDNDVAQRIGDCSINPNFCFFGELSWKDQQIHNCRFQALVTLGSSLEEYHSSASEPTFYYRLDTDLTALGRLFSHPHPHLHTIPGDAPRFPFACRNNEFILISFLEFVFLNHFYDSWLKWAEKCASSHISEDAFEEIVFGFERPNGSQFVQSHQAEIEKLKTALREAKQAKVPALPISQLCDTLTY